MKNLISIIEYVIAFLIIWECGTMYSMLFPEISTIGLITFFIAILFVICLIKNGTEHINLQKTLLLFTFYLLYVLIILLNSKKNQDSFICKFFIIVPMLSIYFAVIAPTKKKCFSILYKFSKIITYLAIISVIMWIGVSCLGKIQPTGYVPYTWGESTRSFNIFVAHYYYIYFETQYVDIFGFEFHTQFRNTGIFTEAPMFCMCLCVSLIIEIFLKHRINGWSVIILVTTLATTVSAAGYVFLPLLFIGFIFYKKPQKVIRSITLRSIVLLFLAFCIYSFIEFILKQKQETSSYHVRSEHIENGLDIWLSAPIFGIGYNSANIVSSSGIWRILADGGIYFFLLYIISFMIIPYLYYLKHKDIKFIYIYPLMFFLEFFITTQYRFITLMFVSLSFSLILQKKYNSILR